MQGLAEPESESESPTDTEVPGASGLVLLTWAGGPGGPPGGERPRDRTAPECAPGSDRACPPRLHSALGKPLGCQPTLRQWPHSLGTGSW